MAARSSGAGFTPAATLQPDDLAAQAATAKGLAELRVLKAGLDLRHREIEEGKRRIFDTQRHLNSSLATYAALRSGLKAELEGLGVTGRRINESLEAQSRMLQEQRQRLEQERMARDTLRDEARRLRELAVQQPVEEGGPAVRMAPQGAALWVEGAIREGQR
eukprot:TRINITY_DN50393_c0_g1_i1.p1 TRINITY_DN50393_c0_g1~~TRINITY_DN50393_c0_g1_i1.p1  ORF type:complete len:162 (+),score=46.28 TRINITY_DN50393_c0_g1_i1:84-569(+)